MKENFSNIYITAGDKSNTISVTYKNNIEQTLDENSQIDYLATDNAL